MYNSYNVTVHKSVFDKDKSSLPKLSSIWITRGFAKLFMKHYNWLPLLYVSKNRKDFDKFHDFTLRIVFIFSHLLQLDELIDVCLSVSLSRSRYFIMYKTDISPPVIVLFT